MNPSLSRTENSWERGASCTTNVAVSFLPKVETEYFSYMLSMF